MTRKWLIPLLTAGLLVTAAQAAAPARDADRLQRDLTPVGAERAGNRDGSIPAWKADQLTDEAHLQWLQDISAEEPLFTINKDNLARYRPQLSAGVQAMFERYPDSFAIPVYSTRRTARQPQWTYDNTRRNVSDARISASGDEVLQAWSGIPFPIPHSPHEVMWNHQLRWKGIFIKLHLFETTIYSNQSQSDPGRLAGGLLFFPHPGAGQAGGRRSADPCLAATQTAADAGLGVSAGRAPHAPVAGAGLRFPHLQFRRLAHRG